MIHYVIRFKNFTIRSGNLRSILKKSDPVLKIYDLMRMILN